MTPIARGGDTAVESGNEFGVSRTINVGGLPVVAEFNEFFLDLGVNGRRCVTCHEPSANMSVTPAGIQKRFEDTHGMDPIFRPNDGSNSPLADVSSVGARRQAYSMLLRKGVIRVGIAIPPNAEFELADVKDPYGYAGNNSNGNELSLFRRPLPTTNLVFLSTVMWDGRETLQKGDAAAIHFTPLATVCRTSSVSPSATCRCTRCAGRPARVHRDQGRDRSRTRAHNG